MASDYATPEIDFADVTLVEILQETSRVGVYRTRWQDKDCVLKVYPPYKPDELDPPFRSIDLFQNESRAYSHLKARGFCQRGVVPDFYGVIKSIDPETPGWQPDLKKFYDRTLPEGLDHKPRPDGVLIEYIPNIKKIDLDNYTEERVRKIRDIFFEIMDAGVIHMDDYPRNMMVQKDTDRVLWIDFDLAQIFDPEHPRHAKWISDAKEDMDWFVEALASDYKLGKLDQTWSLYND